MKNFILNARPMQTTGTTVRVASAALAIAVTVSLFSSVISISEPDRGVLMAQIHNADLVAAAHTIVQVAMVSTRTPHPSR